jgi:phage terminase large subunit-like protein
VGGVGSGKTMAGCAEVFRPEYANTTGAIVAPTFPMLRDATLRTFLGLCEVVKAQGWPVLQARSTRATWWQSLLPGRVYCFAAQTIPNDCAGQT